jgi:uncharacterized membrane protein
MRKLSLLALLVVVCFGLAGMRPAHAQFQVCNQSYDVLNLAVAQSEDGIFVTEGWWTIGANRCVDVIRDELVNRYIYVYATDVFNQPILRGDVPMCIAPKRFRIKGTEDCWLRGHKAGSFMEVDTQSEPRWTLFLREPTAP